MRIPPPPEPGAAGGRSRPNPRMQPTGRGGHKLLVAAALPVARQWKRQIVWTQAEGLQLMRKSLGRTHGRHCRLVEPLTETL